MLLAFPETEKSDAAIILLSIYYNYNLMS
jgi:activator of HSP90 ATPase